MAHENAKLKPVDVVAVADVDAEKHLDDSFVQIWNMTFGHKAKFLFRL